MSGKAVETLLLQDDGTFPNSRLPVMIYRQAAKDADDLERLFKHNGWHPAWRDTVFTYHHYHSRSHECLGVARGAGTLQLGGPTGVDFRFEQGDVVVIPAGVAHRRVTSTANFLAVGAYPPGQEDFDTLRGQPDDRPRADQTIAMLPVPEQDPVEGKGGALVVAWSEPENSRR